MHRITFRPGEEVRPKGESFISKTLTSMSATSNKLSFKSSGSRRDALLVELDRVCTTNSDSLPEQASYIKELLAKTLSEATNPHLSPECKL